MSSTCRDLLRAWLIDDVVIPDLTDDEAVTLHREIFDNILMSVSLKFSYTEENIIISTSNNLLNAQEDEEDEEEEEDEEDPYDEQEEYEHIYRFEIRHALDIQPAIENFMKILPCLPNLESLYLFGLYLLTEVNIPKLSDKLTIFAIPDIDDLLKVNVKILQDIVTLRVEYFDTALITPALVNYFQHLDYLQFLTIDIMRLYLGSDPQDFGNIIEVLPSIKLITIKQHDITIKQHDLTYRPKNSSAFIADYNNFINKAMRSKLLNAEENYLIKPASRQIEEYNSDEEY